MIREGLAKDEEQLKDFNRTIVRLGEKLNIPVCATCDVHFIDPEDEVYRRILMAGQGFSDADNQAPPLFPHDGGDAGGICLSGEKRRPMRWWWRIPTGSRTA